MSVRKSLGLDIRQTYQITMAEVDGQIMDLASADVQSTPTRNEASAPTNHSANNSALLSGSLVDNGLSRRPRDARLLHMILANLGVTAYQERVPLQLMDFAYRYTSSTLQDALHLTAEGHGNSAQPGREPKTHNDMSSVSLHALRLSIASRTHYQFSPTLPKEFYHEIAQERNRVPLPPVGKDWGLRLPPEQYCLTGVGWGLKEEWDSEGEEADPEIKPEDQNMPDVTMEDEGEGDGGEDGNGRMEDFFGEELDTNDSMVTDGK